MSKKHDDFLKKAIIVIAIFLLIFTILNEIIYCITGAVPDTLVSCVFIACLGQGSIMGWIKNTNTKNKKKQEDEEDEIIEQNV